MILGTLAKESDRSPAKSNSSQYLSIKHCRKWFYFCAHFHEHVALTCMEREQVPHQRAAPSAAEAPASPSVLPPRLGASWLGSEAIGSSSHRLECKGFACSKRRECSSAGRSGSSPSRFPQTRYRVRPLPRLWHWQL